MTPNEYQNFTRTTAIYKENIGEVDSILYTLLGLTGEVGEIAEKLKKGLRKGIPLTDFIGNDEIKKELGDVAWYLARLSDELGFTLEDVLQTNVDKLSDRKDRGVLHGSGDNR